MIVRRRVTVHGLVQGVGFRWATREEAWRRGLTGHVLNLPDGTVECEIEGSAASVDGMAVWLAHGPPGARVERTDVAELPLAGDDAFRITR